jgi:hypothetical protein
LIKIIKIKFPVVNFFLIFGHQTLNPGSGSAIRKNAASGSVSGSALNQCGSETLLNAENKLLKYVQILAARKNQAD